MRCRRWGGYKKSKLRGEGLGGAIRLLVRDTGETEARGENNQVGDGERR